jgi:diacylglycerol O-acyltransferase 1
MVGLPIDEDKTSGSSHGDESGEKEEECGDKHLGISSNLPIMQTSATSTAAASMSSSSLATRAAEAELEATVVRLRRELKEAQQNLDRLRERGGSQQELQEQPVANLRQPNEHDDDDDDEDSDDDPRATRVSITRSSIAVPVVARPAGKRGYLFRWMDREIGWSGTKWALRFVALEGGRISYYGTHTDTSPRYVLTLTGCAVRDEGWKRNRRHSSWKRLGRDTSPPPALEEPGAYFFVFSIYQRRVASFRGSGTGEYNDDGNNSGHSGSDDESIAPLLRFSTPSQAEKNQWVQLIAEACAWCETEDFIAEENNRAVELLRQQQQQALMSQAMPEAKEGTLPPLIFASPPIKPPARRPSFHRRTPSQAKLYKTHTQNADVDKMETQKKGYPPSKPMHRSAAPSLLSSDAPPQNYRGLFNLSMIILFVSNFRLLLGTIQQHGFVATRFLRHLRDVREIRRDPWQEAPFVAGFLLQLLFVVFGFLIEWLMSRRKLHPTIGNMLHQINAHSALCIPVGIVWRWIDNPAVGAVLLLHAAITWMKLLSYAHANEDYRLNAASPSGRDNIRASLALVENLDPDEANIMYPENVTIGNIFYFWFAPTLTYQIAFPKYPKIRPLVVTGLVARLVVAIAAFTFIGAQVVSPSLENLVADLERTNGIITAHILAEYWIKLAIANTYLWLLMFYIYFHLYLNLFAEVSLAKQKITHLPPRYLLSLPRKVLCFGDRVFYHAWWSVSDISAYWRLWNSEFKGKKPLGRCFRPVILV